MDNEFDIIEYLSGLTQFALDKSVLHTIALERDVLDVDDYSLLTTKQKELLRADLFYAAYLSPTVWASVNQKHGTYGNSIGAQTLSSQDKERLYNTFVAIYRKYNDDKLLEIEDNNATLQWLDY